MAFKLEKLFVDVFAPQPGEVVTVMCDLPHDQIRDNEEWHERRDMADEWHKEIEAFSGRYDMIVNPIVTYKATGSHNANMPEHGMWKGQKTRLEDVIKNSTIVISMPEFSATAPLMGFTKKYMNLRVASMPMVAKSMEETALSADYKKVAETCAQLAPFFESSDGIQVKFSTGHTCYFDISDHKTAFQDNGLLHPGGGKGTDRLNNLPAGEVCVCPNQAEDSETVGEIPAVVEDEMIVFVVKANQIIGVTGDGPIAERKRREFNTEKALRSIAEVSIGCNEKAVVTGNVLEDEKAGFHWAFGRSDHLGGKVGVRDFTSPEKAYHKDIVYARGNPIVCKQLDFVFQNGVRKTAIKDGVLII
jgi:leucyl aminopeptidase (aminopeptidase T)